MSTLPKSLDAKGGPQISRADAFKKASTHFREAFEVIVKVMRESTNPSDKLGAAKIIINKVLPDLKASEITGAEGGPLQFIAILGGKTVHDLPSNNSDEKVIEAPKEN